MTKQMEMGMLERGIPNENCPSLKVFFRSAQADFFVSVWPVSPLLGLSDTANVKFGALGIRPSLWEHIEVGTIRQPIPRKKDVNGDTERWNCGQVGCDYEHTFKELRPPA